MISKEFKTIKLNNGQEKLTIVFSDEQYQLLSTLFFVDVNAFEDWIIENINDVLQGKSEKKDISGNVCQLIIEKDNTTVYDMFAEDEKGKWCSLPTSELLFIINEWHEQKKLLQ